MTAFPMLARCFEAQWRWLDASDRDQLARQWAQEHLPNAGMLKYPALGQVETPIWQTTTMMGVTVTLLSVKEDYCDPWEIDA